MAVDWSEVTAIATSILAVGLLGGIGAAIFAAQQVREARTSREAQMAAEFFRRWDEDALVEARRLVAQFKSPEELRDALKKMYLGGRIGVALNLKKDLSRVKSVALEENWAVIL